MATNRPARVRVLFIDDAKVALIRRTRSGRTYYVLPGGGVEPGETVEEAAHREVMEELGVTMDLGEVLLDEEHGGQRLVYYRGTITGGTFGTGEWPDHAVLSRDERRARGTYEALWMPLADLDGLDVPTALPALLAGRPVVRMDRLDHIVLTVRDIERSIAFYVRVLGLAPVRFAGGRRAVQFGDQKINLHQAGAEYEPHAATPTPGSADLCFVSRQPLDVVTEQLAREGVPIEEGPVRRTGARGPMMSIYLRDPDGNLIEIASYDE